MKCYPKLGVLFHFKMQPHSEVSNCCLLFFVVHLALQIIFAVISIAFIYWPRCQRWLRVQLYGEAQVSDSCPRPFHCWRGTKKSQEDEKNKHTSNISWLVEPFSWVFLWSPSSATALFFCSLEMHYLSHPCHIQGNTLRSFDILTATEDGHNLQRHSMQAGRQAGIAEAKQ